MLAKDLLHSYCDHLKRLENNQLDRIDRAAEFVARSVLEGGVWRVHDSGHIIDRELIHRSGGLLLLRPFSWDFSVKDPVPKCREKANQEAAAENARLEAIALAVKSAHIRRGDVMTIGSVSGRSAELVELALQCREIGCTVIVISSHSFSSQLPSPHPSGKRLFECADLFIDNQAPLGDGHVELPGYDVPLFPLSGIMATVIMWMICAGVVEKMSALGKPPQIWMSVNLEGGRERNRRIESEIVDRIGY